MRLWQVAAPLGVTALALLLSVLVGITLQPSSAEAVAGQCTAFAIQGVQTDQLWQPPYTFINHVYSSAEGGGEAVCTATIGFKTPCNPPPAPWCVDYSDVTYTVVHRPDGSHVVAAFGP